MSYFCPFKILDRIGVVVDRLGLPA